MGWLEMIKILISIINLSLRGKMQVENFDLFVDQFRQKQLVSMIRKYHNYKLQTHYSFRELQ